MRSIRKTVPLALAVLAGSVALAGCGFSFASTGGTATGGGSVSEPEGTIHVMAEHEVLEPAMVKEFEEKYPEVNIEADEIEGSSEAAAKLSAGFHTDVVETCADEITPLEERGLLQPINTKKLANWDELDPELREAEGTQEGGKQMFVPLQAGPHGLIYNTEKFPNGVSEIKELFNPELKGEVAMGGDSKSMIVMTAFSLGIKNPFKMSEAQLEKVGDYLNEHGSQFRTFPESDANQLNLMKSGEVILMDGGLGTAEEMIEGGVPVEWVRPKEGVYAWVCGLAITSNSKNTNAAYALINYYASAEVQAKFGDEGYVVLNEKAVPKVEPELRATADPKSISGTVIEQSPPDPQKWLEIYQGVISG
ncbi:MAG TPA: extracellular solute-binding protein [Solirubrobacterales bacterium]|nr:extracellular solute-binding protein [Solirubrobacterales bacterium]